MLSLLNQPPYKPSASSALAFTLRLSPPDVQCQYVSVLPVAEWQVQQLRQAMQACGPWSLLKPGSSGGTSGLTCADSISVSDTCTPGNDLVISCPEDGVPAACSPSSPTPPQPPASPPRPPIVVSPKPPPQSPPPPKQSPPPPVAVQPAVGATMTNGLSDNDVQNILSVHNTHRANYQAAPLVWSVMLANKAQEW